MNRLPSRAHLRGPDHEHPEWPAAQPSIHTRMQKRPARTAPHERVQHPEHRKRQHQQSQRQQPLPGQPHSPRPPDSAELGFRFMAGPASDGFRLPASHRTPPYAFSRSCLLQPQRRSRCHACSPLAACQLGCPSVPRTAALPPPLNDKAAAVQPPMCIGWMARRFLGRTRVPFEHRRSDRPLSFRTGPVSPASAPSRYTTQPRSPMR